MIRLKNIAFACLLIFSTTFVSAETSTSSTVVNRINQTKNFIDNRLDLNGTIRTRADGGDTSASYGSSKSRTESHLNADLWLTAHLHKDWVAKLEVEPQFNFRTGKMNGKHDVPMNKLYLEGSLTNNLGLRAGKFGAFSSYGRVFDNEITGGELSIKSPTLPTKVTIGRLTKTFNDNVWGVGVHRNGVAILQSQYALSPNANIGGTISYVQNVTRQNGSNKDAWFGEIGANAQFSSNISGYVAYSRSNIDDTYDTSGKKVLQDGTFAEVKYKDAQWDVPQSYDIYLNARHVGAMSGVSSTNDYSKNVKGVQLGADYIPYKNVKLGAFYLAGKQVNSTSVNGKKNNVNVWRVQAEYKF